jgi:hypothetical protein
MLVRKTDKGYFVVQPGRSDGDVFDVGLTDYATTWTICWGKELRGRRVRVQIVPVDTPS